MLEQINFPINKLTDEFHNYVREQISIDDSDSSYMLDYIFKNKGKGIRPLITLLCSSMFGMDDTAKQRTFLSAMIIEMVHTASLVHDDIIDEAYIRRGKPSVNALWGQKKAVLIGDYIFAKSYSLGMSSGYFDLITRLATVMSEICEGELLQESQTKSLTMTREVYDKIIYGKTASLISACAELGAKSNNASEQEIANMKKFGKNIGMAFQIQDDILDFSKDSNTGKLSCNDLKERKITLPLLCVMEQSTPSENKEIIKMLCSKNQTEQLYNLVIEKGGLKKSTLIMQEYLNSAKEILKLYPDSTFRLSLELLCDYLGSRTK